MNSCSVGGWDCSDYPCVSCFFLGAVVCGMSADVGDSIARWIAAMSVSGMEASLRLMRREMMIEASEWCGIQQARDRITLIACFGVLARLHFWFLPCPA